MISVVIPTLNEAEALPATLGAVRSALPTCELIVADGGSSDGTCALAAAGGARLVHAPQGRGSQLRAGAEVARGDTILLLHADTLLPPGAARAIDAALRDERVIAGAFRLAFARSSAAGLPLMLRLYERLLAIRSRRFGMLTGDQAVFVRAAALRAAGGVPAVPIFDDVRLLRELRRRGRVVLLEEAVRTSPRLFLRHGTLRVALLHAGFRLAHALGVAPNRLASRYPANAPGSGARGRSAR